MGLLKLFKVQINIASIKEIFSVCTIYRSDRVIIVFHRILVVAGMVVS